MSERMHGYQPQWIDGHEVGTGWRDCNARYQAIREYLTDRIGNTDLPKLNDPIHVLDIGAYNGYFCRRLHDDFGANCTAVDGQVFLEPSEGVRVIQRMFKPQDIRTEGRSCDYDVVLLMSILHHHADWYDYLAAVLEVGMVCFIETANPNETLSGVAKSYAVGAERELRRIGTIIAKTPPMQDAFNEHLRPLWAVESARVTPTLLADLCQNVTATKIIPKRHKRLQVSDND